jgi:hypothetical protein
MTPGTNPVTDIRGTARRRPRFARASLAATLLALASVGSAFAGGAAEITGAGPESRMRIEFAGDRLRMEPKASQGESHMIARDGKVYAVSSQGGQPMVIDVGAMMKALGPMMQQMAPPQAFDDVGEFRSLRALGRTEVVAGITGEVHELTFRSRDGKEQRSELVLARDPRLLELSTALVAMGAAFQKSLGQPSAGDAGSEALARQLRERGQGVLRFGSDFKVLELSGTTPAAARFELPAAPMAMPALPGMPGGGGMPPRPGMPPGMPGMPSR